MSKRKVIKDAGDFRFVKITGQVTYYLIQYKYRLSNLDFYQKRDDIGEYLNVKPETMWNNNDWCGYRVKNRKDGLRQFTMCVLKYA